MEGSNEDQKMKQLWNQFAEPDVKKKKKGKTKRKGKEKKKNKCENSMLNNDISGVNQFNANETICNIINGIDEISWPNNNNINNRSVDQENEPVNLNHNILDGKTFTEKDNEEEEQQQQYYNENNKENSKSSNRSQPENNVNTKMNHALNSESMAPRFFKTPQPYFIQIKMKIDNIFLFNSAFQIPEDMRCIYIFNKDLNQFATAPLSTLEIKNLYKNNQIDPDRTVIRPFDYFIFQDSNPYTFKPFNIISSHNWIESIIPNPIQQYFNDINATMFNETFMNNIDNESIAVFDNCANNIPINAQVEAPIKKKNVNNASNERPSEWTVVDKNKKKPFIKEERKIFGSIVGTKNKSNTNSNKKSQPTSKEEWLNMWKPKHTFGESIPSYGKFIKAFGNTFKVEEENGEEDE